MGYVSGNPVHARQMVNIFKSTMGDIDEALAGLKEEHKRIENSWRDEGVENLTSVLNTIDHKVKEATDSRARISKAWEDYADFLERRK